MKGTAVTDPLTDNEQELVRFTLYSRRADAARAFEAGHADRVETIDTSVAMAMLCGWGVDGISREDVRLNILHTAAGWNIGEQHQAYQTAEGLVSTLLAPEDDWEAVDETLDIDQSWLVLGAGLAGSEKAARMLATRAWVFPLNDKLFPALPVVLMDMDAAPHGLQAAAWVRQRGVGPATVDRAYGLLRAAGLSVNWQTLAAAAVGLHAGQEIDREDGQSA